MATMLGELFVKLSMQSDQYRAQLQGIQGQLGSLTNTANLARLALTGLAGAGSIGGTIHLFGELQDAQVRLANITRSMGGSAGFTTGQLNKMADAMRGLTTATKAEVIEAEFALSKFSAQLRGPEFADALKAAQNISNLTGMGLAESAEILGRSLEDPAGMIKRFQRSTHVYMGGPQMERQIEALQNSGQIKAAQQLFMQQIPKLELPDTLFTQLNKLKQEFTDVGVTVGEWFVPSLRSGMLALKDMAQWFNGLTDSEKAATGGWVRFILEVGGGGYVLLKGVSLLQGWTHSLSLMGAEMAKNIRSGAALNSVLGSLSSVALWGAVAALAAMHASLLTVLQSFRDYQEAVTKIGFKTGPIDEKMKAEYDKLTPDQRRAKALADIEAGRKSMGQATAAINRASPAEVKEAMIRGQWDEPLYRFAHWLQGNPMPAAGQNPVEAAMLNQKLAQSKMATAQRVIDELDRGTPPMPPLNREVALRGLAETWGKIQEEILQQVNPQLQEAKTQTGILKQIATNTAKQPATPPPQPGVLVP